MTSYTYSCIDAQRLGQWDIVALLLHENFGQRQIYTNSNRCLVVGAESDAGGVLSKFYRSEALLLQFAHSALHLKSVQLSIKTPAVLRLHYGVNVRRFVDDSYSMVCRPRLADFAAEAPATPRPCSREACMSHGVTCRLLANYHIA